MCDGELLSTSDSLEKSFEGLCAGGLRCGSGEVAKNHQGLKLCENTIMLAADWNSVMVTLKRRFGEESHESRVARPVIFEAFEERLVDGSVESEETLAQFISIAEQDAMRTFAENGPPSE